MLPPKLLGTTHSRVQLVPVQYMHLRYHVPNMTTNGHSKRHVTLTKKNTPSKTQGSTFFSDDADPPTSCPLAVAPRLNPTCYSKAAWVLHNLHMLDGSKTLTLMYLLLLRRPHAKVTASAVDFLPLRCTSLETL